MDDGLIGRLAFWRHKAANTDLGVYVCANKLWVYRPATVSGPEHWLAFDWQGSQWQTAVAELARAFPGSRLQLVLGSERYQLCVTDKPNVAVQEWPQALIWLIKDMVSLPTAQIHLDYFESPIPSNKLNVVVVDKGPLSELVQALHQQGLSVTGISIEELATSNLCRGDFLTGELVGRELLSGELLSCDSQARLVVTQHGGHELMLTVIKQGQLYMQRRVRGFSQLDKASVDDLNDGLADNLSLEIQRSMDYFESQLRQAPVVSIELLIDGAVKPLAQLLSANFNQAVNVIDNSAVGATFARLAFSEFSRGVE
ncbi:MAG: MSHA biogenesis protein MshI [Shewanella sp.]